MTFYEGRNLREAGCICKLRPAETLAVWRVAYNAAIGANCVVTSDVPKNGVVVGVPGSLISSRGSDGYVENTDY